jgi:exosome complex component RRP41
MQHADILALAGLRVDGRLPDDLRVIRHKLGSMKTADGSCYFEQGLNKVLVTINGPQEIYKQSYNAEDASQQDKGSVKVTYSNAAFSGLEYKRRGKTDRRIVEIENNVMRSLEGVIMMELYKNSEIQVNINCLEADGSILCTILNACSMALMDAGIDMKDMLCACSVGKVKGILCQDLNQVEQSSGVAYMPIGMLAHSEEILFLQLDRRIGLEDMEPALDMAIDGCRKLKTYMTDAIKVTMKSNVIGV